MTSEPLPLSMDSLLAEARWLENLARALVADREEARDLVQEVWAKASESGREHVERPRAWLATLLHNALRSRRRAAGAREVRERSHARESSVPGAGDVVARAEAQRSLVEHVLALDEPWRSTVLLRFYDGLSGEEIARRLGVPASTVRNRLAHALELLRARLERSRRDWMAGLALLAGGRARAGVSLTTITGGVLMGSGMKLMLGAATAALVLWWRLAPNAEEAAPARKTVSVAAEAPEPRAPASLAAEREPLVASAPELAPPTDPHTPAAPTLALPPGVLEVLVLDDFAPCAHAGLVELAPNWYPWMPGEEIAPEATVARPLVPGKPARFTGLAVGSYGVRVELAGHAVLACRAQMPNSAGVSVELYAGSASFFGTVWDEEGLPVAGATIDVSPRTNARWSTTSSFARTAEDGTFELAGLCASAYHVWLRMPETGESPGEDVNTESELAPGERRRLDFGTGQPLPHWRGVLRTRTGAEHRGGATLTLRGPGGMRQRPVDAQGSFDVRLAAGTYAVECKLHELDSFVAALSEIDVPAHEFQQDLVLPGARLDGRIEYAGSAAALTPSARTVSVGVRMEGHDYPAAVRKAWVETDGRFAIDALEPGVYLVNTHPLEIAGGRDSQRLEILPSQDVLSLAVFVRPPRSAHSR